MRILKPKRTKKNDGGELKVKVISPEKWKEIRDTIPNYIYFPIPEEVVKESKRDS